MRVFLDVDEVILNSIEAVCQILNKRYDKDLHEKDIMSWNFKEYGELGDTEIEDVFDSQEFFDIVEVNPKAVNLIRRLVENNFDVTLVTKGREQNIERKKKFLQKHGLVDDIIVEYIGLTLEQSKGEIDMSDGILIDDNQDNLNESNAWIKILCVNNDGADWNKGWNGLRIRKDNLDGYLEV